MNNSNIKPKVLVLGGPTAVGKTALAVELAKELNGEIISADSMQIYKYMDIGSAKVTEEEQDGIKHYLIDVVLPDKPFSAADFKEKGQKAINEILSKGKLPIIVGGTGLYINALTCNMNFTEAEKDEGYRRYLDEFANEYGNEALHMKLKDIDSISYNDIHFNNRKRVIRALEVYKLTGKAFSEFNAGEDFYKGKYDVHYYVLTMNREKLYSRINKRVDIMINSGLIDECINLKNLGYTSLMQSIQGIGYKEIFYYLEGKSSLEKSIEDVKQGSRNYAKRQLTWFRRDPRVIFLDKDILQDKAILSKIKGDIIGS